MILLSPEDAELLKMNELQLAAKTLREGGAPGMAAVCERANAEIVRLREALEPFAKAAALADKFGVHASTDDYNSEFGIKWRDFRRARAALPKASTK